MSMFDYTLKGDDAYAQFGNTLTQDPMINPQSDCVQGTPILSPTGLVVMSRRRWGFMSILLGPMAIMGNQ